MTRYYADDLLTLELGNCVEVMRELPADSVDAVVTDPPYGLEFMGREWDKLTDIPDRGPGPRGRNAYGGWHGSASNNPVRMQAWHEAWAREAFRVAKPGAHLLAFGGTRTYHRLASAIEDAGWEIRDCLVWAYASGFPKSLDVGKAIDKAAGAEREVVGRTATPYRVDNAADRGRALEGSVNGDFSKQQDDAGYRYTEHTAPATPDAAKWDGWGTALKPAWEPIVMARKPLRGTVAQNVLAHGTGALNIDGTRIPMSEDLGVQPASRAPNAILGKLDYNANEEWRQHAAGRWPANLLLTDPIFDGGVPGVVGGAPEMSRFYVVPKSSRSDREPLLRGSVDGAPQRWGGSIQDARPHTPEGYEYKPKARENSHPTVKPLDLMRHLVRLVTPPGGTVLDPFLGSGTTAIAANAEGFRAIGIEREQEYLDIAVARLAHQEIGLGLDVAAPVRKRTESSGRASGYNWDESVNDNPTHVTHNIKSGVHYGDGPRRKPSCKHPCHNLPHDVEGPTIMHLPNHEPCPEHYPPQALGLAL